MKTVFLPVIVFFTLIGCSTVNPHFNPQKSHHTPEGFKNNYSDEKGSFGNFLKWQWERLGSGNPKPPTADLTPITPNLSAIQTPSNKAQVSWVGHSTVLVQANGVNVLTDPVLSDRASPVSFACPKRLQAPGLSLAQLPKIDVVVISHNHYDHLDYDTVKQLAARPDAPTFLVPLGVELWFKKQIPNAKVQGLDWQDKVTIKGVKFTFLPVQHWSSRSVFDRNATLWGSWAMHFADSSFWFSGDLGYSQDTVDIGKQFPEGFDFAMIAVGAYEPRWFMKNQHINEAEAVQIFKDIKAKKAMGIHWGTFNLTDEPADAPLRELPKARTTAGLSNEDFVLLKHGQTLVIKP